MRVHASAIRWLSDVARIVNPVPVPSQFPPVSESPFISVLAVFSPEGASHRPSGPGTGIADHISRIVCITKNGMNTHASPIGERGLGLCSRFITADELSPNTGDNLLSTRVA